MSVDKNSINGFWPRTQARMWEVEEIKEEEKNNTDLIKGYCFSHNRRFPCYHILLLINFE